MAEATITAIKMTPTHWGLSLQGPAFSYWSPLSSPHPVVGYYASHFTHKETRHREVEPGNQDHTAEKKWRWNLKQGSGPPEQPSHAPQAAPPGAQTSQLSKCCCSCLLHVILLGEARLRFLKHKSEPFSCSNTFSGSPLPLSFLDSSHTSLPLSPAASPLYVHQ